MGGSAFDVPSVQEPGSWHHPTSPLAWTMAPRHIPGAPRPVGCPPPCLQAQNSYGNSTAPTASKNEADGKNQGVLVGLLEQGKERATALGPAAFPHTTRMLHGRGCAELEDLGVANGGTSVCASCASLCRLPPSL